MPGDDDAVEHKGSTGTKTIYTNSSKVSKGLCSLLSKVNMKNAQMV